MAIFDVKAYGIECDRCGDLFEDPRSGFSLWTDERSALEEAQENDWIEYEGKCYCPHCYDVDEDDNWVIKAPEKEE